MAKRRRTRAGEATAEVERGELLAAIGRHMAALAEVADAIGTGDPLAAADALKRAVAGLEWAVRRVADRAGYPAPATAEGTAAVDGRGNPPGPRSRA